MFELFYSKGLEVMCSSGVGGGSHVYSAVHRRPARMDYWDGVCDGLSEAMMAEHNSAFLTRMGSPKPVPQNEPPHDTRRCYHNDPHFEAVVSKVEVRTGFLLPDDPDNPNKIVTDAGVERCRRIIAVEAMDFWARHRAPSRRSTFAICHPP
ncbi:MAG: hypothetical protein ISP45_00840 [Reyranella sp.]|jgi:cholesterol oxidase|nr:hypothetical protein [Reyranella sp.]